MGEAVLDAQFTRSDRAVFSGEPRNKLIVQGPWDS